MREERAYRVRKRRATRSGGMHRRSRWPLCSARIPSRPKQDESPVLITTSPLTQANHGTGEWRISNRGGPEPAGHSRFEFLSRDLRQSPRQQRGSFALLGGAELLERAALDLPDALPRDGETLADLFQRVLAIGAEAVAQAEHLLLAIRKRRERAFHLLREVTLE